MNPEVISSLKANQYLYAYNIKVSDKVQEVSKQNGANVMKLINSAVKISPNKIDLYA